jgi:CubicO group peptidase (beta-lactamase class C family)
MLSKLRFPIPVLLLLLAGCSAEKKAPPFDDILRNAVASKWAPGVVATVATADGVVYEGSANLNKDTIFAIASMTKPITSVAVMQLVEAGKVKLDAPASMYVPELGKAQVLEGGKLRAPKSQVTVRQLLTHTSGYGYEFMNRELFQAVGKGMFKSIMAGGDAFLQAPLLFDPGERWEYGISTDWLGRLVERVSGESLDVYFQQNIFDRLGMNDTFFQVPETKKHRVAQLYQRKEDGSLALAAQPPGLNAPTFFSGGGGLYSTASDYLRFARAILGGGVLEQRRILKAETVAEMGRNQIGALTIRPFSSMLPAFATDNASLPGELDKFGFGFALNSKSIPASRGANTMSWAGIFNTYFWIDREKKVCAVVMAQMSPGLDPGPKQLFDEFDRAVYAWLK